MRLQAHNKLSEPIDVDVTRVIIYDNDDNPIVLVVEVGPGMYHVTRRGEQEFTDMLEMVGFDRVSLDCKVVDAKQLKPLKV